MPKEYHIIAIIGLWRRWAISNKKLKSIMKWTRLLGMPYDGKLAISCTWGSVFHSKNKITKKNKKGWKKVGKSSPPWFDHISFTPPLCSIFFVKQTELGIFPLAQQPASFLYLKIFHFHFLYFS